MTQSYNLWMLNHYAGNLRQGMEYRHFFLARHLREMGHRVSLVSATFSHLYSNPPKTSHLVEHEEVGGVEFLWLKTPGYSGNGPMRLVNMLSYSTLASTANLGRHLGKPDVVLGSSPQPFVMLNTLALAKRYSVPSLIEIRDLWPLMLVELGSMNEGHPLARVFQRIEKKAFREADRVISLWHSADEYMLKNGVDEERYRYLPNGIELGEEVFSDEHPLLQAVDAQKRRGRFVIGYGGSHGHANPLTQVLDACKVLRDQRRDDVAFIMVGDGPDKSEAMATADRLGLENLSWFDPVPKDVIMAFYARLDSTFIGLRDLPLFKYGPTPNKLMDYLAAGKPIIYAIRSSFDPVAEHELGRSIEPDDGDALARAIVELKEEPDAVRAAMGERARQFAETEHSYSALAGRLDEIVRGVL